MKASELIAVLQKVVDAGLDDETDILFDTEARTFDYHMAKIGSAYFDTRPAIVETFGYYVSLHEAME